MFLPVKDFREEETQTCILAPSLTFYVGDLVKVVGSGATLYKETLTNASMTSGAYPIGVLVGFTDSQGRVLGQGQNPSGPVYTSSGQNYLTTSATNLTTEKYYGVFLPITPLMTFIGDLSAVAGTTNYSGEPYSYFQLSDCRTISESSAVAHDGTLTNVQVLSLGLVEDENQPVVSGSISRTKIYCKIIKSAWTRAYTG
jgi:hypothetical protein